MEPDGKPELSSRQARTMGWTLIAVALSAMPVYALGIITLANAVFVAVAGLAGAGLMFSRSRNSG